MGKEKRRYKRLPIRGFMQCSADFVLKDQQMDGIDVLSLSAGGMFIAVNESLNKAMTFGDDLRDINLHLSELNGMKITGKVAHTMSLGEIGGCGVEFQDLNAETIQRIDRYVHRKLEEFGLAAF